MPRRLQAWYGFLELAALGDRGAELTGNLELTQLTRLSALLHGNTGGPVSVRIRMGRADRGDLTLTLAFEARLSLLCQRCLEPVDVAIDEQVEWIVVESQKQRAPEGDAEVLALDAGRIRIASLVEDEIIVSLPMIPRHASIDECGALAQNLEPFLRTQEAATTGTTLKV